MSDPSRQLRRYSSRVPVRISRNYTKLPPISQTARSTDTNNDSSRSADIIHPAENALPPTRLTPLAHSPKDGEDHSLKPTLTSTTNDTNHHSSIPIDASKFWVKLGEHVAKEPLPNSNDRGHQRTPNKVVRIFVSSTFTDFFNEREVLIKQVFPELRDELEPAGIQIIDCDLRWGVPKDSTTEQTILACMEELDRCFEDNGQPFFIGLVSDKYGWVPKITELPGCITDRYRWIDGASITLMEFIHGAFRTHNPNAFFLMRNSENILKNLPEKYTDKFRDKDEQSQRQIQELKVQLSHFVPEEHIFHYDCFYNGLDSTTGRERVKIDGLHDFAVKAKEFLSNAIKNWYPENFHTDASFSTDDKQMNTFLLNKTQFFVDRHEEFSILLKYVTGEQMDLNLLTGMAGAEEKNIPMMAIKGRPGDGKTMLLGKFALHLEETMKDKFFLFYHFLDGAFHPNVSTYINSHLKQKLDRYIEQNKLISPHTGERPAITSDNFISQAISLLPVPFVIIIDGLDKGDIHHQRKYREEFIFYNYEMLASDHTYIILSCEPGFALYNEITRYNRYEIELKPLTIEQRSAYIERFFRQFNKVSLKKNEREEKIA
ncbi:unnamed protein product [Adineta ricciae]|uniref:Uncharacterized protein n=1 Tax=Adineta ricciae TaxID=249248 RepID=A0A815S4H8_ADIRI|nr:unnamed protein product [Adineta ricciae]